MNLQIALGVNKEKEFSSEHYGDSHYFLVYEWNGTEFSLKEERINQKFNEEKHGDEKKAKHIASQLPDVPVLVSKVFGPNIVKMKKKYVTVVTRLNSVDATLNKLASIYDTLVKAVQQEGDKEILYLKED